MNKEILKKPEKKYVFQDPRSYGADVEYNNGFNECHELMEAYHSAECERIEQFHNDLRQIHVNKLKKEHSAKLKSILEELKLHSESVLLSVNYQDVVNIYWLDQAIKEHCPSEPKERG